MKTKLAVAVLVLALWGSAAPPAVNAEVVVLANRSRQPVTFTLTPPGGKARKYTVGPQDVTTVPVAGPVTLTFAAKTNQTVGLKPNRAHCFADLSGGPSLQEVRSTGPDDPRPADPKEQAPRTPRSPSS